MESVFVRTGHRTFSTLMYEVRAIHTLEYGRMLLDSVTARRWATRVKQYLAVYGARAPHLHQLALHIHFRMLKKRAIPTVISSSVL